MNRKMVVLIAVVVVAVLLPGCASARKCGPTACAPQPTACAPCRVSAAQPTCGATSSLRGWYSGVSSYYGQQACRAPQLAGPPVACGVPMVCVAPPVTAAMETTRKEVRQTIEGNRFCPSPINVACGQTVVWTNNSKVPHTITADPSLATNPRNVMLPAGAEPFNSGPIEPGKSFSHTFSTPGTYRYFSINEERDGMVGEVVVK